MSTILPDGTYTFTSTPFPDSTLYLPGPGAKFIGEANAEAQTWVVKNTGALNVITLTNSAYHKQNVANPSDPVLTDGTAIVGSDKPYEWLVNSVADTKGPHIYFTTTNKTWIWHIESSANGTPVTVRRNDKAIPEGAKWDYAAPSKK